MKLGFLPTDAVVSQRTASKELNQSMRSVSCRDTVITQRKASGAESLGHLPMEDPANESTDTVIPGQTLHFRLASASRAPGLETGPSMGRITAARIRVG